MAEGDLDAMLQPYGRVVSTRVLRDPSMKSRGVGFARMETREVCEKVIEILNGKLVAGNRSISLRYHERPFLLVLFPFIFAERLFTNERNMWSNDSASYVEYLCLFILQIRI